MGQGRKAMCNVCTVMYAGFHKISILTPWKITAKGNLRSFSRRIFKGKCGAKLKFSVRYGGARFKPTISLHGAGVDIFRRNMARYTVLITCTAAVILLLICYYESLRTDAPWKIHCTMSPRLKQIMSPI